MFFSFFCILCGLTMIVGLFFFIEIDMKKIVAQSVLGLCAVNFFLGSSIVLFSDHTYENIIGTIVLLSLGVAIAAALYLHKNSS